MAQRDDSPDDLSDQGRPDESKDKPSSPSTEDTVFPEAYRKFWRTLLGPWGRR